MLSASEFSSTKLQKSQFTSQNICLFTTFLHISSIVFLRCFTGLVGCARGNQKIFMWDLMGERLLRTVSVPKRFCAMAKIRGGYIGYMGNYTEDASQPYNFYILDDDMNVEKGFVEINHQTESRYNKDVTVFSTYGHTVSFVQEYDYDIYRVEDNLPYIFCSVDFGKRSWPASQNLFVDNPMEQMILDAQYIKKILKVQETPKHLMLFYNYQGQGYMSVHDKDNHSSTCFTLTEGIKDLFPASFGKIVGADEHGIFCTLDAETIHDLCRGKNENNDFDEM